MNNTFYGSPEQKKVYLKKWIESKDEYKKKNKIAMYFRIISLITWIICIITPVILLIGNETLISGIIAGAIVGLIFALIPFFIGGSIKGKAFQEYGYPFGNIEQECLRIYDDGVEYLYHNASSRYSESMDVYRIPIENINAVNFDQEYHIITIIGEGELLAYDDYAGKRLNHQKSQRRFYGTTPYPIIAAFEDEKKIVQLLKNMAKNRMEV